MLKNMLRLDALPTYFDATDALGVAVCHYLQNRLGSITDNDNSAATRHKDWKSFLQKPNPNRLKKEKIRSRKKPDDLRIWDKNRTIAQ
jgi:crossover junction endodeoxyribonuclease RuvC